VLILPAIDLKEGRCVRLRQGRMDQVDIYGDDPTAMACHWVNQGAGWLHVVDLDGAVRGEPVNHDAVAAILGAVAAKVQVGGGIRTMAQIEWYLTRGATRVVMGTSALQLPAVIREAARRFPGRVAVSLDARGGELYIEGWTRAAGATVADAARDLAASGVTQLVLTDIQQDGMLAGLNIDAIRAQVAGLPIPAIIAGGVTTLEDLVALRAVPEVNGAIIGKALYARRIDLPAALQCVGA
jgi:phosphoribosylformimino-5-aminoimidazole carboxamide ribotide isomerase